MKKKLIIYTMAIGLILLLFTVSFNHLFSRSYHHFFTNTTDLSNENVEGLYVNAKFDDKILQKFGAKTEQSREVTGYDYFELRNGIEVAVNKTGQITRYIVTDRSLKTAKGIKIGDDKNKIMKAYGEYYYVRTEQGANILGYVDKNNDITLEFWLLDDKVDFYKLDHISMK